MDDKNPASANPPRPGIAVDETALVNHYMNFCRVSNTPEEVILDFGFTPTPAQGGVVRVNQRIICNFFNAKRLLMALSMAVQEHEKNFGVIEVDVGRRVRRPEGT
jgi:hypothetical protein